MEQRVGWKQFMKRKVMMLVVLWGILTLLAFLYSDKERLTWSFDRKTLEQVASTEEIAAERQRNADSIMDVEMKRAMDRRDRGIWGAEETEIVWEETLPAVDSETGLNLVWGGYTVTLEATPETALSGRLVSAGYQSFIENGEFSETVDASGKVTVHFRLTDTAPQVMVAIADGFDQVERVTFSKDRGPVSADVAARLILLGLVLSVLILFFDGQAEAQRLNRRDALLVLGIAGFAGMPLLWPGLYDGHDLLFHLNRIEGIAAALRCGQFPVRIHASTLIGYGYAASEFYPELFLYLPALMRNAGVSLTVCVQILLWLIHLATAGITYYAARRLLRDRGMAVGATALYMLSLYRLVNIYTRATLGESLAMTFFPLVILAMRELLVGDWHKWPMLALSMFCIFMSHLLSTMFCALFCAVAVLCCLPRLIREPKRILGGVAAAGLCILCSLWFLIPMLNYVKAGISTNVVIDSWVHALHPGSLLVGFAGGTGFVEEVAEDFSYTVGVVPGLAPLLGTVLALVLLFVRGIRPVRGLWRAPVSSVSEEETVQNRVLCFIVFSALALFATTTLFPWKQLCSAGRSVGNIAKQIQFPWRLVGIASPFLALAGSWGYLSQPKYRQAGAALLSGICLLTSGYMMQHVVEQGAVLLPEDAANSRLEQFEYMYPYTEKEALRTGNLAVRGLTPYTISNYRKQGTTLTFDVEIEEGDYLIEAPYLYYPGYRAVSADGTEYEVDKGNNNVLRVQYHSNGVKDSLRIYYAERMKWRLAEGVSLIAFAVFLFVVCRRRVWR